MTPEAGLIERTRAVIERVVGADRTPAACGPETPLADGFWLDSVEMLEVVVACEREFDLMFDDSDQDLGAGAFATLGTLCALILRKQGGRSHEP